MAATTTRRGNIRHGDRWPEDGQHMDGQHGDSQHGDSQHGDSQHMDSQHGDSQHGDSQHREDGRRPDAAPARLAAPATLTIDGLARNVSRARAFVAEILGPDHPCADVAVLLCSELVTNAILHSESRRAGGTVTILVAILASSVQVNVIDEGSGSTPVVKADICATDGHGLFLVNSLADQWGYERGDAGTTVWFQLTS
jgi:anti-sigma regulatory factor (Ser/Thr protein kinase)